MEVAVSRVGWRDCRVLPMFDCGVVKSLSRGTVMILSMFAFMGSSVFAQTDGELVRPSGADEASPYITDARVVVQGGVTRLRLESVGKLEPRIYAVAGPDRIVVDADVAGLRIARLRKVPIAGLVNALRYGELDRGAARIVMDVSKGARVSAVTNERMKGRVYQLNIDLTTATVGTVAGRSDDLVAQAGSLSPQGRPAKGRPVIVIDPGHGGIDPGAVVNRQLEKSIVLAVAQRLEKFLQKDDRFSVVLTRNKDVFVSLDERIAKTRAAKGDLFLSLHADSIEDSRQALTTSGAAVYILSHRASTVEARRLAEKENAVDLLAGLLPPKKPEGNGVRNILVDLLKRETERGSTRLRKLLINAMRQRVPVSRQPFRSAAFHVLKQTETPAALIELGYMTNAGNLRLMQGAKWQERMAGSIARAVETFFGKN